MQYYSRANFPQFVGRHGAWNIYANAAGQVSVRARGVISGVD